MWSGSNWMNWLGKLPFVRCEILAKTDLVGQHGFSGVTHGVLGVAGLFAVDEDDSSQPANHAHRPGPYQLLLSDHGAAVRQDLHHACREEKRISTERLAAQTPSCDVGVHTERSESMQVCSCGFDPVVIVIVILNTLCCADWSSVFVHLAHRVMIGGWRWWRMVRLSVDVPNRWPDSAGPGSTSHGELWTGWPYRK